MTFKETQIWLKENFLNKNGTVKGNLLADNSKFKKANEDKYKYIYTYTPYLDEYQVETSFRINCILEDVKEIPTCKSPHCSNKVNITKRWFTDYCCNNCNVQTAKIHKRYIGKYNLLYNDSFEEMKEWIKINLINKSGKINGRNFSESEEYYQNFKRTINYIKDHTKWLTEYIQNTDDLYTLRCNLILADIKEVPKCKICNKPVKYSNKLKYFLEYCSNECSCVKGKKLSTESRLRNNELRIKEIDSITECSSLTRDEMLEFIESLRNDKGKIPSAKTSKGNKFYRENVLIYNQLIKETSWMNETESIRQRIYAFENEYSSYDEMDNVYSVEDFLSGKMTIKYKCGYTDRPTILYYIRIKYRNQDVYKAGITCLSVQQRFKKELNDGADIEILREEYFETGRLAWEKEQWILLESLEWIYKGKFLLDAGGNTELRIKDIEYLFDEYSGIVFDKDKQE